jgi:hypothetical protein
MAARAAAILGAVNTLARIARPAPPAFRVLLTVAAFWGAISVLGALTSLNDDLREGLHGSYVLILAAWARSSAALALLSMLLYAGFARWPGILASVGRVLLGYAAMLALLLPLQFLFILQLYLQEAGTSLNWDSVEHSVRALDEVASVLRLWSITAVYFGVAAIVIWQHSERRARDTLALRLELERQRSLALRAQLEPHFMFNALNAISALVRAERKEAALGGIQGLSMLLRYALEAGERSRVSVAEELRFVEDYLALQRLRYGARLQLRIEGADAAVLEAPCLPLLLQPLVENALRHDLDCHDQASDIRIRFTLAGPALTIAISNPVHAGAVLNPGTGLGLRTLRARLQLAYGARASVDVRGDEDRFTATVHLPAHEH